MVVSSYKKRKKQNENSFTFASNQYFDKDKHSGPEVRLKIEKIAKKHAIAFDNFDSASPLASLLLFVVLSISSSEFYEKWLH